MKTTRISHAIGAIVISIALAACGTTTSDQTTTLTQPIAAATSATTAPSSPSLLTEPTGPEAIGTREVPAVSPDANGRLWYPAVAGTGTSEPPYISADTAAVLGLPPDMLDSVQLRASLDASPAPTATPRPAIVLMPGWGAPMAVYTTLAQDLASNGFVVLSIEPALGTEDGYQLPPDPSNPARRLEQLSTALDFLTGPQIDALAGPVDPTRIAAGGHSIAGAVAVQASLTDRRIAAVFDLDGWLHGPALDTSFPVPSLFVEASGFDEPTNTAIEQSENAVIVHLAGAAHFDVTDIPCLAPLLGPMSDALGLGAIGCTGSTTTNALVEHFLDVVLVRQDATPTAADISRGLAGIR